MNDTELFELCKRVYELTEWECGGEYVYHHNGLVDIVQGKPAGDYWENNWWFPLYTSDYLLEKLPVGTLVWKKKPQRGSLYQAEVKHPLPVETSDTPLKALLKLTIALHDSGVKL